MTDKNTYWVIKHKYGTLYWGGWDIGWTKSRNHALLFNSKLNAKQLIPTRKDVIVVKVARETKEI